MTSKKWLRPIWIAAVIAALVALYVGIVKKPPAGRFFVDLSNSMFLMGLTLLCVSLTYVTRFFGFLSYFQNWFRLRPAKPNLDDDSESGQDVNEENRDPSLVYASLLLIGISVPIYYI